MPSLGEREKQIVLVEGTFTRAELRALAAELGAELTDFAFKSERILSRLDIRAARRARALARELILLEVELSEAPPCSTRVVAWADAGLASRFGRILRESLSVLTSCDAPSPGATALRAHAASFDDPDEITDAGLTNDARQQLFRLTDE